jgi:carnitine-CoA ligase
VQGDAIAQGFPAPEQCVLPAMLERRLRATPDEVFAVFEDGERWTFQQLDEQARRVAGALHRLGVGPGDPVLSWLPNGPDAVRVLFGVNRLNALYMPINTAYRGNLLQHVIDDATASVLIVHHELYDRLSLVDTSRLGHIIVLGEETPEGCVPGSVLDKATIEADLPAVLGQPWDPFAIIYTSGTTGPSKGVVSSYAHMWAMNTAFRGRFRPGDRFLVHLPMFHSGGLSNLVAALEQDGSVGVIERFERQQFWQHIATTGCTAAMLISAMVTLVVKEPPTPTDRENPLRALFVAPFHMDSLDFCERFGVEELYTQFNMTEVNTPLMSELNPTTDGTCGRPRVGVEVRLVDQNDIPVAPGHVGEMILRADLPWTLNSGYWGNAEATARAWRNGWFHTGDAFRVDDDGNYFFVDRIKDTIRRRGENISSFEVEAAIIAHPAIHEAAAVAVPSDTAEDEVMAVVELVKGVEFDRVEFMQFLTERLPHFMVPRYLHIVSELPKTPTGKIMKKDLRVSHLPSDTWDREAEGMTLRRQRFGPAVPRATSAVSAG